jgi:hypothetical protein
VGRDFRIVFAIGFVERKYGLFDVGWLRVHEFQQVNAVSLLRFNSDNHYFFFLCKSFGGV